MGKLTPAKNIRGLSSPLSVMVKSQDSDTLIMVRNALEQKRVMLAFQPVMQASEPNKTAFYEGLIRVLDVKGRIIPAKDFIEVIEDKELGRIIDTLTLEKGFEALAAAPNMRLSINMSIRSIGYSRWKHTLATGLKRDPTSGERLIIEISEKSVITIPDIMKTFIGELQSQGISIALDHFGSGYSSFKCLRSLYFDILKIDGGFIRGIHQNPDNHAITKAMISLARELDIVTVAESIETHTEANTLIHLGIDCLQGYYFGMPTITPYWQKTDPRHKMG